MTLYVGGFSMMKRWIAFAAAATFLSCSPRPGTSDHKEAPKGDAPAPQADRGRTCCGAAANIDKAKVGELIKRYHTSSGRDPRRRRDGDHGHQAVRGPRSQRGIAPPVAWRAVAGRAVPDQRRRTLVPACGSGRPDDRPGAAGAVGRSSSVTTARAAARRTRRSRSSSTPTSSARSARAPGHRRGRGRPTATRSPSSTSSSC